MLSISCIYSLLMFRILYLWPFFLSSPLQNINKCSIIWVVNSFERILGGKTHEMLLKEGMKAFQSGMCRDIALVVTKSDELDPEEYKK